VEYLMKYKNRSIIKIIESFDPLWLCLLL